MTTEVISTIGNTVLEELDHFSRSFKLPTPRSSLEWTLYSAQQPLYHEPFVAYVRAEFNGQDHILYFTRGDVPRDQSLNRGFKPKCANGVYLSYKLGFGLYGALRHLPELDVGDTFDFSCAPNPLFSAHGHIQGTVLEKHIFRPKEGGERWDAVQNRFFLRDGEFSSASLRKYLEEQAKIDDLEAEKRFAEEQAALAEQAQQRAQAEVEYERIEQLELELQERKANQEKIKLGLMKVVVDRVALRDQQILDANQGAIFRSEFSTSLIISGAPGTGKTTTLIKRISRLVNSDYLSEDEKQAVSEAELLEHFSPNNWILFTPNELLKIYLKEALGREGLATTDNHVRIWNEESKQIARKLGYLGGDSAFRLTRQTVVALTSSKDISDYLHRFQSFYLGRIQDRIDAAAKVLAETHAPPRLAEIFRKITRISATSKDPVTAEGTAVVVVEQLAAGRAILSGMRGNIQGDITSIAKELFLSSHTVIEDVIRALEQYGGSDTWPSAQEDGIDAPDSIDSDDDDVAEAPPETEDASALANREIKKTLRWYCQLLSSGKSIPKKTIAAEILSTIKDSLGPDERLRELGHRIRTVNAASKVTRGYRMLLEELGAHYHAFRRTSAASASSPFSADSQDAIKHRRLSDAEIDVINYAILRNVRLILRRSPKLLREDAGNEVIENAKALFKTQIAVDEATDFSAVQLGCMFQLTHPRYNSFTMAGDLMQRVTTQGIASWNECDIFAKMTSYSVNTVYRQSPVLLRIAKTLYERNVGSPPPFESAYLEGGNDPKPLMLLENDDEATGEWIAARIAEIQTYNNGRLPSIALFVDSDESIDHTRAMVEEPLLSHAVEVRGCPRGEILGSQGKVRIFSVKYIKGLEFEGVFFVGIDRIAERHPEVIDKYLYVGLTRAASFLAVTAKESFPEQIQEVQPYFASGTWAI